MGLQNKFLTFDGKIYITRYSDEYKKAREKDDSITEEIRKKFKENGYPVQEDFIQGSLATSTTIKEKGKDFDIDRAIVIKEDDAPEDPTIPKKVVLDILENRGFKNAKIKKPCVTADYQSEDLHIDIPIYSKSSSGLYKLAVGKKNSDENNREWSDSDPKGLQSWINQKDNSGIYETEKLLQFKRLTRYIKRWRNFNFHEDTCRKVFSIGLTVMFKQKFQSSINDEGLENDLEALKKTIDQIIDNSNYFLAQPDNKWKIEVYLPVSPYRDIFSGSSINTGTQLRNKLSNLRTTLQKVIDETDESKQCGLLRTVFGDDFPESSQNSSKNEAAKVVFASAGSVGTSQGA
ncbi:nucleotidyltransferase [Acinetobacter nosocomialis]|uniref:nucleotidyltransferase domain-containing protein n=1 Tax=Acinetobacter calcoaceticus/baumannii complex TaxID=909768 RepID=UPI0002CFADE7|nr:nucleotidyltransferase [Acinetobacter nosocomialis]ENU46787.1 hypothetical protein F984_02152 [Acinetobacter nosocomialis NIPH 2119]MDC4651089.1 nucleotidyltransferase [Acinetobacter baumannii]QXC11141.1 nucleotidyltransferase [Acinetobacter nosocomialis]HAV5588415.1 nucleotidyltransferase [Acinetobacter baumannii]